MAFHVNPNPNPFFSNSGLFSTFIFAAEFALTYVARKVWSWSQTKDFIESKKPSGRIISGWFWLDGELGRLVSPMSWDNTPTKKRSRGNSSALRRTVLSTSRHQCPVNYFSEGSRPVEQSKQKKTSCVLCPYLCSRCHFKPPKFCLLSNPHWFTSKKASVIYNTIRIHSKLQSLFLFLTFFYLSAFTSSNRHTTSSGSWRKCPWWRQVKAILTNSVLGRFQKTMPRLMRYKFVGDFFTEGACCLLLSQSQSNIRPQSERSKNWE